MSISLPNSAIKATISWLRTLKYCSYTVLLVLKVPTVSMSSIVRYALDDIADSGARKLPAASKYDVMSRLL